MSDIGLEVKIARILAGKKQDEIAAELGVSQATISRIEAGTQPLAPHWRQRLLAAVNWSPRISEIVDAPTPEPVREECVR